MGALAPEQTPQVRQPLGLTEGVEVALVRHELRELLGDLLSEHSLRLRGLFDPIAMQQLINDNDAGRRDGSYTLRSLLCIEIWWTAVPRRATLSD